MTAICLRVEDVRMLAESKKRPSTDADNDARRVQSVIPFNDLS